MIVDKLFDKKIHDITPNDLTEYFQNPKEESNLIEYKAYVDIPGSKNNSYKEKETVILENICGFLNSMGGLIIWGSPIETKDENGNKFYQGDLKPIPRRIKKDDFVSKIINRIIPVPSRFDCQVINLQDNRSVLLIEVEKSPYRPHQFNHRYYMRLDGQNVKAPHYFIEAMFKEIKFPDIRCFIRVKSLQYEYNSTVTINPNTGERGSKSGYYIINLKIVILNLSKFINEEDLFLTLSTNRGFIYGEIPDYIRPTNPNSNWGETFHWPNFIKNLHYGNPYNKEFTIKIADKEFGNGVVQIQLHVGGKYSPIKLSQYTYKIKRTEQVTEIENLVMKENILLADEIVENFENEQEYINKLLE